MHENKTKHNLARDTNAWKNPNTTNNSSFDYNTLYKVPLAIENGGEPTIPSKLTCTANNRPITNSCLAKEIFHHVAHLCEVCSQKDNKLDVRWKYHILQR
jgi:hypothetical protein